MKTKVIELGKLVSETAIANPGLTDAKELAAMCLVNADGGDIKDLLHQALQRICADFLRSRRNAHMNAVVTGLKAEGVRSESKAATATAATATATGRPKAANKAEATRAAQGRPANYSPKLRANWERFLADRVPAAKGVLKPLKDCTVDELRYCIQVGDDHIAACESNQKKKRQLLAAAEKHNVNTVGEVKLEWLAEAVVPQQQ